MHRMRAFLAAAERRRTILTRFRNKQWRSRYARQQAEVELIEVKPEPSESCRSESCRSGRSESCEERELQERSSVFFETERCRSSRSDSQPQQERKLQKREPQQRQERVVLRGKQFTWKPPKRPPGLCQELLEFSDRVAPDADDDAGADDEDDHDTNLDGHVDSESDTWGEWGRSVGGIKRVPDCDSDSDALNGSAR